MSSTQYGLDETGQTIANRPSWALIITRTYSLYARNFWLYFRIAVVPALVAYFFQYLVHQVTLRLVGGGAFQFPSTNYFALIIGLGWVTGAGFWIISAFFFAAISATFAADPSEAAPAVADAYTVPRERIGALLAVAVLTWTLFWLGRMLAGLAIVGFFRYLDPAKHYWTFTALFGVMLLLVAALVSKFGLAIPDLMHNPALSTANALKGSWRRTEGWEVFFMLFLIKSAVAGYLAYWMTGYALEWIAQHWTYSAELYSWIEWGVYICIAAALESPLFIAFSVLSQELRDPSSAPGDEAAISVD